MKNISIQEANREYDNRHPGKTVPAVRTYRSRPAKGCYDGFTLFYNRHISWISELKKFEPGSFVSMDDVPFSIREIQNVRRKLDITWATFHEISGKKYARIL